MTISARVRPFSDRNVVPAELRAAWDLPMCSRNVPDVDSPCPLDACDFGYMRTGYLDDDRK